jgi:hypothetical protein
MMNCDVHPWPLAFPGGSALASHSFHLAPLNGLPSMTVAANPRTIWRSKFRIKREGLRFMVRDARMLVDRQSSLKNLSSNKIVPMRLAVLRAGRDSGYSAIVESDWEEEVESNGRTSSAADETLDMLGWPSLCDALARFATTAMGKELCQRLTPPSTIEESQVLLDETTAGLELDSCLGGVLDFGALQTPIV